MVFKNDYIMRMIEQLGLAWAEIVSFKRRGKYDEAEALISRTAQRLLGFDMGLLRQLSDEAVIELLRRPDASDVGQYFAAAELLRAQGEIDERRDGPDGAYDCNHKALSLYLECYLKAPDAWTEELTGKVASLLDQLRPYALPAATRRKLFLYHEGQGNFAQAENVIHHLMENGQPGAWEDGLGFYERLQAKSDAELERGGLPREEVEEGRLAFEELAE